MARSTDPAAGDAAGSAAAGFPVVVRFPVHWGDMDALGHVNNARYFTWFESARMALFERVGLGLGGRPGQGPILAHVRCDFLVPVRHPAEVASGTRVLRLGTTSFAMEHAVWLAGAGERPVARGEGVVVLIDLASGRKVPLPAGLRAALERLR